MGILGVVLGRALRRSAGASAGMLILIGILEIHSPLGILEFHSPPGGWGPIRLRGTCLISRPEVLREFMIPPLVPAPTAPTAALKSAKKERRKKFEHRRCNRIERRT